MIVIFVVSNVITRYNLVGIFEVLFYFDYLFFILRTRVSAIEKHGTREGRGIYETVTKVLSAEDDPMLYPFLPYATARDTPATISWTRTELI